MKQYRILSFYLMLVLMTSCQCSLDDFIKKEVKKIAPKEAVLIDTVVPNQATYGDLPDSVIAEIKLMDSLIEMADQEVLDIIAKEEALKALYQEQLAALDSVSLEDWETLPTGDFKKQQLAFENVQALYETNYKQVKQLLTVKGIHSFDLDFYMRAFKDDGTLELWAKPKNKDSYTLITTYPFYQGKSTLGPKQRQGDCQVPEGCYYIDYFNPQSSFNISLRLSYPNKADKIRNAKESDIGGAICMHGGEASIGCLAITDLRIPTVYILAIEVTDQGQEQIPIHVFPARLTTTKLQLLEKDFANNPTFISLWRSLEPLYVHFEKKHQLPSIKITAQGYYKTEAS